MKVIQLETVNPDIKIKIVNAANFIYKRKGYIHTYYITKKYGISHEDIVRILRQEGIMPNLCTLKMIK